MKYVILVSLFLLACDIDDPIVVPDPEPQPTTTITAAPTATAEPEPTSTELFIPDNCGNPPKTISSTSGFLCKGSETRGDTIVCLLPWEFTWQPYIPAAEGHLSSSRKFNNVHIFLKNGNIIDLTWAGYANPVFLQRGKVNRQHWRDESRKWDSIKNRVDYIEMIRGNKRTCLKF